MGLLERFVSACIRPLTAEEQAKRVEKKYKKIKKKYERQLEEAVKEAEDEIQFGNVKRKAQNLL